MNAGKVSDEIKDAIAYNNARSVNVALSCKDEEGSLFPQPTYQAKLGYDFEVQFIPNTQNYLVTDLSTMLKAVSRINDEESREEYVQFTPVEQSYEDKKSGLYRVKVKIVKYADDIKICPNGTLIPKIKDIYPPYNPSGYSQDSVIRVTFNKPVNPESFGDFSCISFESGTNDISSCYGTPYFSSDNTVLFIPPVPGKKIIDDQSQNNAAEVTLKINCTNLTDEDGLSVSKFEPYTYCVNKTVDSIAPTITSFEMTTTGDTNAWYYRTLTDDAFEAWSAAQVNETDGTVKYYYGDFSRNHVGKSVHIKLQGYDNADAISGVLIREVFEKDVAGNNAGENESTQFIDDFEILTDENGVAVLSEAGNKIYSFDFDYVLQSKGDGLVLLEVYLKDGANKDDHRNYEVIKQSETNKTLKFFLEVDRNGVLPELINGKYKSHISVPSESNSDYVFVLNSDEKMYGNYSSATSKFSLYFYDEHDIPEEVFKYENFKGAQDIESLFNEKMSNVLIDSYRDIKAKAVYYEETGITKDFDFIIPKGPDGVGLFGYGAVLTTMGIVDTKDMQTIYTTYQKDDNTDVSRTWNYYQINLNEINSTNETTNCKFGLYKMYVKKTQNVLWCNGHKSYVRSAYGQPVRHIKRSDSESTFELPFTVKNKTYESSTGMVTVELNISYPNDGKLYYISPVLMTDPSKTWWSEKNSNKITIPNGVSYYFWILRQDPNLGYEGRLNQSVQLSFTEKDNFPPKFDSINLDYSDSSFLYINNVTIDDLIAGAVQNPNPSFSNFICYYLKTHLGENPSVETAEQLCVDKKIIKFENDPDNTGKLCARIPFADVEQGEYYLYAYLSDGVGNSKLQIISEQKIGYDTHGVYFSLRDAKPTIEYVSSSILKVSFPSGYSGNLSRYKLVKEGGKWGWKALGDYSYASDTTDYNSTKGYYIKVTARDSSCDLGLWHLKPLFYYPNYVNKVTTCNNVSWLKVDNGYQIFCDAPAFCHTLYSTRKITSGNTEKDALEWEAQAQETGIVVSENGSGFTYKNTNLDGVPSGDWYTTICHFADGTVLMSPVEQMHK